MMTMLFGVGVALFSFPIAQHALESPRLVAVQGFHAEASRGEVMLGGIEDVAALRTSSKEIEREAFVPDRIPNDDRESGCRS